jgi:peptide/nickel transport system substrate-binding protein
LVVCDDVADPATLDPQKEFVEKTHVIVQQIFDGLARFDSDGKIVPALAERWTWVDGTTLELHLRSGVLFHNGEACDSKAVKFSLERYLDPKTGYPAAGYLASISSVEAPNPLTVRIKTKFPDGLLMNSLAGLVLISPPRYIDEVGADRFAQHPVGTGPFRFVSWTKGKEIVLEANPHYWAAGLPKYKGLVFTFLPPDRQVDELLKGNVDIVTELPGTATLRVMKSGTARVIKKEGFYTVAGSVNISSSPLADVRVRRAINHAINREELIRYDLLGNGRPLATTTMPGEIGHDPGLTPYAYDRKKARALLRDAGYPDGLKLKVIIKYQTERTARIIAKQLERVGISLDIHKSPDSTLSRDIQSGSWDFTIGGCPDPLSHSFFVQSIFLFSKSPFSIMRDSAYDDKLMSMVSTLDLAEQQRLGMELDRYLHAQALSIFTYQKIRTYGVSRSVDFIPSITGVPYFQATRPNPL